MERLKIYLSLIGLKKFQVGKKKKSLQITDIGEEVLKLEIERLRSLIKLSSVFGY